jgi:hypothetical protein
MAGRDSPQKRGRGREGRDAVELSNCTNFNIYAGPEFCLLGAAFASILLSQRRLEMTTGGTTFGTPTKYGQREGGFVRGKEVEKSGRRGMGREART